MMGIRRLRRSTGALAALLLAGPIVLGPGAAEAQPASPQPSLPKPLDGGMPLGSPIIGGGKGNDRGTDRGSGKRVDDRGETDTARSERPEPDAGRRSRTRRAALLRRGGHHRHSAGGGEPLERPALAGVELVAPIPVPVQPPHLTVPVPAYPLENAVTYYTTPLPPVICRRVPRDPAAPDPHLIRETTVLCEADNP